MKLSIYDSEALTRKRTGPLFWLGMVRWSYWGVGLEFIPYGILLYLGPFMLGVCHEENYAAARNI